LAGQAEVNEVVAWGSLCPVVSCGFSFEVPTSIDFDRVESVGVHPRRIEHDVVCRTVPTKQLLVKGPRTGAFKRTDVRYFAHARIGHPGSRDVRFAFTPL
jgi:hypothetical protein